MTSKYDAYVAAKTAEQAADDVYAHCEHSVDDVCEHRRAYDLAAAAAVAAYAEWLRSDEPREYEFGDDSGPCGHRETCKPSELDDKLRDWIEDGEYEREATIWARGYAWYTDPVTGERDEVARVSVTLDPVEPDCVDGGADGHVWRDFGDTRASGAGVVYTEACERCGCLRTVDTWAQDRCTGEQGLTSTQYDTSHKGALAWLELRLQRAFVDRVAAATAHLDGVRLQDAGGGVVYVWCDDDAPVFSDGLRASFDGVKYIFDR
jgi:hypothetical protein